jgi:hypothetical protein
MTLSKDDLRIIDDIINKTRHSIEEMSLQHYSEFSEFQIYLMNQTVLNLTTLKESMRATNSAFDEATKNDF